jgi:sec-independent protein translocase protein TatA
MGLVLSFFPIFAGLDSYLIEMIGKTMLLLGLGTAEMVVILFVILLLFGAKKIPELARGLGRGIREFKDASKEVSNEINKETRPTPPPPPASRENTTN